MQFIEEGAPPRRLPFCALIWADAISLTGNALTQIAVPWFVLTTTGSAARTGLVAFCGLLPLILAAFLGGAIVDRLGRRRMSIVADVASMACVAAIPLLYARHALAFWQLLALVFVRGLLDAPGTAARAALLPDVAALARLSLVRANAIHEVVESGSQVVGPALAGVLVSGLGASNVLWADAASFAVSAALIAAVPGAAPAAARTARSYRHDLAEGLRFVFRDPPIRAIFVSATALNFLISPLLAVILPVYMKATYNSAASLGLVIAAFGGGSVLGAIAYGVIGDRFARRSTFIAGVAGIGAAIATLAALPPVSVMVGSDATGRRDQRAERSARFHGAARTHAGGPAWARLRDHHGHRLRRRPARRRHGRLCGERQRCPAGADRERRHLPRRHRRPGMRSGIARDG